MTEMMDVDDDLKRRMPTMDEALKLAAEVFPDDHPADADAARPWALARGMDEGDDVADFVRGEARCDLLQRAKDYRKAAPERALIAARVDAVAAELGGSAEDRKDASAAIEFSIKAIDAAGGPAAFAEEPEPLTDAQRVKLEAIHASLREDFALRRRMLLTRLDVTMQGFLWGDGAQGRESDIVEAAAGSPKRLRVARFLSRAARGAGACS